MDNRQFTEETAENIQARLLQLNTQPVDKREGSITYDFTRFPAIEFEQLYTHLDNILLFGFARTTHGKYLDMRAEEVGLHRKLATSSIGVLTFNSPIPIVIPAGTQVTNASNTVIVETLSELTIDNVSNNYTISAATLETGKLVGAESGTLTAILSDLGVEGVTVWNDDTFSEGHDSETDEELKRRYEIRTQSIIAPGNEAYYRLLTTSVPGVYDARIYPRWNGVGSVKIICLSTSKRAPSPSVLANVIDAVNEGLLLGVNPTIEGVDEVEINVEVKVTLSATYAASISDLDNLIDTIRRTIDNYFTSIAFNALVVRYSHIGEVILNVPGVLDYENLSINGATTNITLTDYQVPVLHMITVTT